jgi:hypothetical protein
MSVFTLSALLSVGSLAVGIPRIQRVGNSSFDVHGAIRHCAHRRLGAIHWGIQYLSMAVIAEADLRGRSIGHIVNDDESYRENVFPRES